MRKFAKYVSALFISLSLLSVMACASTPKQEGTGEYVDDTVISTKVRSEILKDASFKASREINVETFKGIVQLSGFVTSQSEANKAIEIARSVNGVKSVKNDMRIK